MSDTSVAVVGLGVVGARVARQLTSSSIPVLVHDRRADLQNVTARALKAGEIDSAIDLHPGETSVVVLATPSRQGSLTRRLVERGLNVVCTSDDVDDVRDLLELDGVARANNVSIVVGAAASPGLSGLLVAELASRVDVIDEIHVGVHGTGGPACARQHHRALAGDAPGWHDGEWISRPGGSGRELLWFPEPIGGRDCYRAELADPLTLQRAFPSASRISARMSATRRDRLTARLPMMSPPHAEGGIGGVRVEIRGSRGGERRTEVAGTAERTGIISGAMASAAAVSALSSALPVGVVVLGAPGVPNGAILDDVIKRGITIFEYVGSGV
ncbi:MAG: hypothetical protein RLZ19_1199 [Actinomycetota bacterium]|jgi:saccharopine dehydrogenase-like NADP-dependent oxidoreductase